MRRGIVVLVVLFVVGVAGALGATTARASDKSVSILGVNQGYSPGSVTVNPGDTVTWTDRDPTPAPHNAICDESCPEPFSSGNPGATGTIGKYQFRYSGTYNYKCAVHPNMKGAVVVTGDVHPPAGAAAGRPATTAASAGAASGAATPGPAPAVAGSGSGSGAPSAVGSPSSAQTSDGSTGAADVAKTPLPPVGQLALPEPQVRVHQASSGGTPGWVLVPASLVLVIAAGACALAWLGPRPLRRTT